MTIDRYTRAILTVIAAALVYLCALQTPWPIASAQTAPRPGESTGPAEVVIVGWQLRPGQQASVPVPVQIAGSVPLNVTGEVRVMGPVDTRQLPKTFQRVALVGWEERGQEAIPGRYRMFNPGATGADLPGVPVAAFTKP